jgi:hypothetical protein
VSARSPIRVRAIRRQSTSQAGERTDLARGPGGQLPFGILAVDSACRCEYANRAARGQWQAAVWKVGATREGLVSILRRALLLPAHDDARHGRGA